MYIAITFCTVVIAAGQCTRRSSTAHNAGLVDPRPHHPYRLLDAEAHNASVRTTALAQEEAVEVRAHKTGTASGAQTSAKKLAAPDTGPKSVRPAPPSCGSNNLVQIPTVTKTKQSTNTPSFLYTNCKLLNTRKLAELQVRANVHQPNICLAETRLNDEK